jgi:ornithine cyclodeaminase/alanine dehydrogenase-like protein (mu-crystallin family)
METLIITAKDVSECLTMTKTIELIEHVFNEWGKGNVVMPAKTTLDMSKSGFKSWLNAMPAYISSDNAAGIKWVGGYPYNSSKGLPYIMGVIILTDTETGQTLAIMDGALITGLRTGASAAISSKYLGIKNIENICIVGAGTQGKNCALSLSILYPDSKLYISDMSEEKRRDFITEMSGVISMQIIDSPSVEEAVKIADLIVLVTTASEPFVNANWIKKGATVLAMGSFQQLEDEFATSADKIVVDSTEQACHRGELKLLVERSKLTSKNIYSELGDIVAGVKFGRETKEERILMVPVGLGAHDVLIAQYVYKEAIRRKLGLKIDLIK